MNVGALNWTPSKLVDEQLQDDAVLPTQFSDILGVRHTGEPVQKLMLAILVEAWHTVQLPVWQNGHANKPMRRPVQVEAFDWFTSDDDEWLFTFRNVCDALSLDYQAVRRCVFRSRPIWTRTAVGNDHGPRR